MSRRLGSSTLAARVAVSILHKNVAVSFSEAFSALREHLDAQECLAALFTDEVVAFAKESAEQLDSAVGYKREQGYDCFCLPYRGRLHPRHQRLQRWPGAHAAQLRRDGPLW